MNEKELNGIIAELGEYYECAGFQGFYESTLKGKTEAELRDRYKRTFKETDHKLEEWEERYARGQVQI